MIAGTSARVRLTIVCVFWAATSGKPRPRPRAPRMCDGGVPLWHAPFVCSTRWAAVE